MLQRLIKNDHELFVVLFVLLCKLAEENKKGNIVIFPPETFDFPDSIIQDIALFSDKPRRSLKIAKKDINFSFEAETRNDIDMPEAIRRLGITLYHLSAGKSELTHESFLIDGYRAPFEGAGWPLILAMIRGEIESPKIAFKLFRSHRDKTENNSDETSGAETKKEPPIVNPHAALIADWQTFYRDVFGIEMDFPNLAIPKKPEERNWRLLIIIDLLLEALYAKCKSLFPCWRWTDEDLDEIVTENERTAKNGPYAIWAKDNTEADGEWKNLSADDIKGKGIKTETLAERFVHELKFFKETGKHLDIANWTLCSGSRYSDGNVPNMNWNDGKMNVNWYNPDNRNDNLCPRQKFLQNNPAVAGLF